MTAMLTPANIRFNPHAKHDCLICLPARKKLTNLADDYQQWRLQKDPETATSRGNYTFNDRVTSFNVSRHAEYKQLPLRGPVDTKGDVENDYRRLLAWPTQIAETLESMEESMLYNTTNHNVTMKDFGAIFDRILNVTENKESGLYMPFTKTVETNTLGYSDSDSWRLKPCL